jgi:hypothetical protein
MTWNSTLGLISSIALLLPVLCILFLRLGAYRTFPALLIYYGSVFINNILSEGYIAVDPQVIRYWGISNNLMDIPLLITFLIYFSTSISSTRRMRRLILGYVIFEVAVLIIWGINIQAITIILGPGIAIAIYLLAAFFVRQSKITVMHRKATGKALISAALLFAYGCYGIIYLMYYVFKTKQVADTFLIYFFVLTFSSILVSIGIISEQRRVRKLNELKLTRRELSDVYAAEKKPVPLSRTAMLDFDREQWN